jgi:transposase-like protein
MLLTIVREAMLATGALMTASCRLALKKEGRVTGRNVVSPELRKRALAMVDAGASLRSAAKELGVSRESIRTWVRSARAARAFEPVEVSEARAARKPILVDGKRLGRLALWK